MKLLQEITTPSEFDPVEINSDQVGIYLTRWFKSHWHGTEVYNDNDPGKFAFNVDMATIAIKDGFFKPYTDESAEEAMYRFEQEQKQKTYTDKENAGTLPETQAEFEDWWQEDGWHGILQKIRQKALLVILDAISPVSKKVFVNPHAVLIDYESGDVVNPALEWTIEVTEVATPDAWDDVDPEEWA